MTDSIIQFFDQLLNNDILTILIISIIPIIELRGSIPVAIEMGLPWYEAFGYAFLGSMIVVPFLLLLLMPILNWMKKIKIFRSLANAVEDLFSSKAESITKKLGKGDSHKREEMIKMIGVLCFVAIPLPLTGVWTGSAVALFVGLSFWKSLAVVAIGNVSAGLIMTGLSVLLKDHIDLFLKIFMGVVLGALLLNILYVVIKKKVKAKKLQADESITVDTETSDSESSENVEEVTVVTGEESDDNINLAEPLTANTNAKIEDKETDIASEQ